MILFKNNSLAFDLLEMFYFERKVGSSEKCSVLYHGYHTKKKCDLVPCKYFNIQFLRIAGILN